MSAQEFGEWRAWLRQEQQLPVHERLAVAQVLASLANGPLTRKVGGLFRAGEFMTATWSPPTPAAVDPAAVPTSVTAAQIAAINARMG